MKTFAAALLSLSLLSYVGIAEAAATSSKSKATQTRKVKSVVLRKQAVVPVLRAVPTFGQAAGLHDVDDPLDLKSSVAYVLDQNTNEVLFSKNPQAVLPIASITKLMTALVVVEAGLPLDEKLTVSEGRVLGLYDLAGNLGEWCRDCGGNSASASFERIAKGGAWSKDARYLAIGVSRAKWERLGTTTIGLRPVWDDASR